MKKVFTYSIIFSLIFGCAPSPYITTIKTVYESPTAPGFEKGRPFYDKMSNKLDECYKSNNFLADFYEKAILISLDSYIICNDDMLSFFEQKLAQYNEMIPKCKNIVIDGFRKIGVVPKQNNLIPLRLELASVSYGDKFRENITEQVKKEIENMEDGFWASLSKKFKEEREKNYNELISVTKGEQDTSFINVYINLNNYQKQEEVKLEVGIGLYEKCKSMIINDWKNFINSLTEKQKQLFNKVLSKEFKLEKDNTDFLRSLNPYQIYTLSNVFSRTKLFNVFLEELKARVHKAEQLKKWLSENKEKAEQSLQYQEKIRTEKANAITSALLIGLAGGLSSYGDYLARPRPQTIIQQPSIIQPQNPQFLYDTQGKTYYLYK